MRKHAYGMVFRTRLTLASWAHEICTQDSEERAIVTATMGSVSSIVHIWLPLIVWQQVDTPEYRLGFITMACLAFFLVPVAFYVNAMHHRQLAR